MTFKLPATLVNFNRKVDRTCGVRFDTQELPTEGIAELDQHYGKFGWLIFSENPISTADIPKEQAEDTSKTPSKRLRDVLFVLWKQKGSSGDFEMFYRERVEKIINHIKTKLDE